jgi:glycosyltransferase involved in cell wall biosynthesis
VLRQDFGDFEVIVVDDGSTDGSLDVIRGIDDPRIRLLAFAENSGASFARNCGIAEANAPLICFLDSDDEFLPHKLSKVVSYFGDRPDLGLLIDSFRTGYPRRPDKRRRNPVTDDNEAFLVALFNRRMRKATPAITVRRDVAIAAGLFDTGLKRREDFDFSARVAAIAKCASTDQVLWLKRWSRTSLSASAETFVETTLDFCRRHPEYVTRLSYRRGLAIDLRAHFSGLVATGRLSLLSRDLRSLSVAFGMATLMELIGEGWLDLFINSGG